ncbi:MAG TPA: fused MFS/spermidine synthase [Holophagaceae bacterium]
MDSRPEASPEASLRLPALTIFLSAFLLFEVQPLVGKLVLPWFGGSAGVWTICLLFFQLLLLGGYLYAHTLVRHLSHRRQVLVHGTLLLLAAASLPLRLHPGFRPTGSEQPLGHLLGLLAATVGLPYFLLSTTGPLVQAWVARQGQVPYRLFALSNLASMLALLSYPVAVEPFLPLRVQAWTWSLGFLAFAALVFVLARRNARTMVQEHLDVPPPAPAAGRQLSWILLAALPSVLLMAVTSHLSTNVAPIPFLWVVPLALYLLSFILCFDSDRWYRRGLFLSLLPLCLAGMALLLLPDFRRGAVRWQVLAFNAGLFVACMTAHGELARLKPHPRHLTGFYLRLSLGGALGGLFVAVAAPHLFRSYLELPLALAAFALLALVSVIRDRRGMKPWPWRTAVFGFGLLTGGLLGHAIVTDFAEQREAVDRGRNFYGALRVFDDPAHTWRSLAHGTILHGGQFLDPARARLPLTYYSPDSGVGLALASLPQRPRRLGVVGLGAGSLAVYGRPGDLVRFYEINPLVETFARRDFTFLRDCPGRVEVVLGDARLSLDREPPEAYDLLAIDAFSSDAIPVHLLTREAFALYLRHLAPGGYLAVHISNRYLDLKPVVQAAALRYGLATRLVDTDGDDADGIYGSTWIVLARSEAAFAASPFAESEDAGPLQARPLVWRDDFSNLFRILK